MLQLEKKEPLHAAGRVRAVRKSMLADSRKLSVIGHVSSSRSRGFIDAEN